MESSLNTNIQVRTACMKVNMTQAVQWSLQHQAEPLLNHPIKPLHHLLIPVILPLSNKKYLYNLSDKPDYNTWQIYNMFLYSSAALVRNIF